MSFLSPFLKIFNMIYVVVVVVVLLANIVIVI